jgi:hypothetical protein
MMTQEQNALRQSQDPKVLVHAAQALALSDDPADQAFLSGQLRQQHFLSRLDDDPAYAGHPKRLRLWRVLRTLSRGLNPARSQLLVELTEDATFVAHEVRVDLLIQACTPLRPCPPEVLRFWDAYCQPDDGFANLSVRAMVENDTDPALDLFFAKLRDPAHELEDKLEWLRQDVLPNRNHLALLQASLRNLLVGLPAPLDDELVQVLFDYRPESWYRPATVQMPPDAASFTLEARDEQLRIARYALANVVIDQRLRELLEAFIQQSAP